VSANHQIPDIGHEGLPTTLGTLLVAVPSGRPTLEAEWVGLVHSIGAGDQEAFRHLYGRLHAVVYTLSVRIVHDKQTAEEVTLDVFHDVWRRAAAYDEAGGTVVGWVMNQARSRAIDQTRFARRKKRVDPYPRGPEPASEDDSGFEMDSDARNGQLRAAVAGLTVLERRAIEMAFFAECSYAEAARRLHQPAGTVKSRIRSGLEKLRRTLDSRSLS
jgi:RNA polymerase sigma-70 factor (ECF subfamily)